MKYYPYPTYKDSGVEWLGKIPEGWAVTKTKYTCKCNPEVLSEDCAPDFEMNYIEISDVQFGTGIVQATLLTFGVAPSRARRIVQNGDVIISTVRTYLKAIAQVDDTFDGAIVSTGFAVLRPVGNHPTYLQHLFHAEGLHAEIISRSTGVSYPAINAQDLIAIPVPLPPLPTQRAIAAFLDTETARIDGLIKDYEELVGLLREKRQALISHAVTRGLSELVRPDESEFGEWAKPVAFKDSGVEWLGEIPEGWEVKRLKQIAAISGGIAKGGGTTTDQKITVPYLRVANVQDGHLDLEEVATIEIDSCDFPRFQLKKGDVLMNEGGDNDKLGRGTVWTGEIDPCIHQNHVFKVRPYEVDPRWIDLFTSSNSAKAYFQLFAKQSTNLASISMTNLSNVPMTCPPLPYQHAIAAFLDRETGKMDTLVAEAESAIELLKEHRSALITNAVTGKINVEGQI